MLGLLALLPAMAVCQAAEPSLDLRSPAPSEVPDTLAALRMDNRPSWMQRMDAVARHGLPFFCLRQVAHAQLVLGAHPNGYIGVFTTPVGTSGRRGRTC